MNTCRNCGAVTTGHGRPKLCQPCWQVERKSCKNPGCRRGSRCQPCVARRKQTAQAAQQRQFAEYKELLHHLDVPAQWDRWRAHLRELRGLAHRQQDRRLRHDDYLRFWLDRFTMPEIRQMAGAIIEVTL